MNQQTRRRHLSVAAVHAIVSLVVILLAVTVMLGCQPPPAPTATALPSPTPAPLPTPTPTAPDELSGLSTEVRTYLLMVRPITTNYAIIYARDQPVRVLEALVQELALVEPPPEMLEAHALLKEGYELLAEGGALLATHPDPVLRSEARFIQDWGMRQLWEHRRFVAAYLEQVEVAEEQ